MEATTEISLCGIPTIVKWMGGEQQGIISGKQKKGDKPKTIALAQSVLVSVGDYEFASHSTKENDEFMGRFLACHIKEVLVASRQFTYDDEPFIFTIDYMEDRMNAEGKMDRVSATKEFEIALDNGLAVKPVKQYDAELIRACKTYRDVAKIPDENIKPLEAVDYQEVVDNARMEFTLPKSKLEVRLTMRDTRSASVIKNEDSLDANVALLTAIPERRVDNNWIRYTENDLKRSHAADLEFMRAVLKRFDGSVDTEMEYEHPGTGQISYTDMVNEPTFFFPSGGV